MDQVSQGSFKVLNALIALREDMGAAILQGFSEFARG